MNSRSVLKKNGSAERTRISCESADSSPSADSAALTGFPSRAGGLAHSPEELRLLKIT